MKPVYLTPRSVVLTRVLWVFLAVCLVNLLLMVIWVWPWTGVVIGVLLFVSPILAWFDR